MLLRAFVDSETDQGIARSLLNNKRESLALVSSELLWLESDRAIKRLAKQHPTLDSLPTWTALALEPVQMIDLDRQVINAARAIPEVIKSLDAIHVASAELLADAIAFVVTCDRQMAAVLNQRGLVEAVTPTEAVARLRRTID